MKTVKVPIGNTLIVTAVGVTASVKQVEDPTIGALIWPATNRIFGPYLVERNFLVSETATATLAVRATAANIGSLFFAQSSAPVTATQATLNINPTGDDNGVTFTSVIYGSQGVRTSIHYRDPGAVSQSLSVSVVGNAIVINLATDANGDIITTAAEIVAAVNANPAAAAVVAASLYTADSGSADDGSGVVTAMPIAVLTGGSGSFINEALPGAWCIDYTNGATYTNTGTKAAPVWTASVTTAAYAATSSIVNGLAAMHLYGAGAPVNYTDGDPPATGEGTAPTGALYSDTTSGTGRVYRNSGTQAQPTWTMMGDAP